MWIAFGRWVAVVLFVCVSGIGTVVGTSAQAPEATPGATPEAFEPPKFSIYPVGDTAHQWFDVTMEPGSTEELTAGIRNTGTAPVSLETYAANAINPPNGGFAAGTDEDEAVGPTLWLDYPADTFDLGPSEERDVDFTVVVPPNTPPGEYFAALVVQTVDPLEIPGSENLRQVIRSTISVEITVPGEMTSGLELGTPEVLPAGAQWVLDMPITNTGTTRLRPAGELVVTNADGDKVVTSPVAIDSIYGGNTTSIRTVLPEQLRPGDYRISVDLTDEATGASAAIADAEVTIGEAAAGEAETFVVDEVAITPNAEPIQFANVSATITNNGQTIPTATVLLNVQRDGEEVESYPLAENQALPQGSTEFSQRYIPIDGWQPGTYTFQLVIAAVSGGTETVLATIDVNDEIVVP